MLQLRTVCEVRSVVPTQTRRLLAPGLARIKGKKSCTVLLVSAAKARFLNRRFRGGTYYPDVLSFPAEAGDEAGYVGEIVVAPAVVRQYAQRAGTTYSTELAILLAHGVLHLLGHEHDSPAGKKKMEALGRKTFGKKLIV